MQLPVLEMDAQFLTRAVVSSFGAISTANGIQVSSTLGESISGTLKYNHVYLTQGFQQPISQHSRNPNFSLDAVDIYPNPFTDRIMIAIGVKDINNYYIDVYSLQGRILESFELKNIFSGVFEFSLGKLPPGTYLLHVRSSLLKTNRTFRIVKI